MIGWYLGIWVFDSGRVWVFGYLIRVVYGLTLTREAVRLGRPRRIADPSKKERARRGTPAARRGDTARKPIGAAWRK